MIIDDDDDDDDGDYNDYDDDDDMLWSRKWGKYLL